MSPVLALALVASASAAEPGPWHSDPAPVVYADEAEVFSTIAFDTGYWPSATDPIAVRFHLTPVGGVQTELYGTSDVAWPELSHRVLGEPGGWFGVQTDITIGAEVKLDLFGLYSGTIPLWEEQVALDESVDVDGLLLPGAARAEVSVVVDDPNAFAPIEYAIQVIPTIDLVVGVGVAPELEATMTGVRVVGDLGGDTLQQDQEDTWVLLPDLPDRPGELGMLSTWTGSLRSHLSLVIEPEVRVDTLLGAFTLAAFPIPVTLVDDEALRTTPAAFVVHPLPVTGALPEAIDLGEVQLGQLGNYTLPIDNLGALLLQGTVAVDGNAAFTVWPETLAALPEGADGVVVTFSPTAVGESTATLVLATNDPWAPEVRIPLSGLGVTTDAADPDPDPVPDAADPKLEEGDGGCGCDLAAGPGAGWALWALVPLLAARRRQFDAGVAVGASDPPRSNA